MSKEIVKADTQVVVAEQAPKGLELIEKRSTANPERVISYLIGMPNTPELLPTGLIRQHLRQRGLKGRELTEEVNNVIKDASQKRQVFFDMVLSQYRAAGFVADAAKLNAKQNRLGISLIKPKEIKPKSDNTQALKDKIASLEAQVSALKARTSE